MSPIIPTKNTVAPTAYKDEGEMNNSEYNEKAPSAPESEAPSTDTEEIKLSHFRQLSFFDKLWVSSQGSAIACCLVIILGSCVMYFTTDLVNCDDRSPYSQALISGLYALLLSMYAWMSAYYLGKTNQKLNAPNSWSMGARQRRRQRLPIFFAAAACGQYIAAFITGLVAYRTSRGPLGWNIVYVAARIGMTACLAAGTCDMWLAISSRRSTWNDSRIPVSEKEKKDEQEQTSTTTAEKESTILYDIDFTALPPFDKQWLAVHVFTLVSLLSVATTSSLLLWQTPCGDNTRKSLITLSNNSLTPFPQLATIVTCLMQTWLPRVTNSANKKYQSRFMIIMTQLYFGVIGVTLSLGAYYTNGNTNGLLLVKLQSVVAGIAFLLCSGYDYALMLKTNFNAAPTDTAAVEQEAGKQSEHTSQ